MHETLTFNSTGTTDARIDQADAPPILYSPVRRDCTVECREEDDALVLEGYAIKWDSPTLLYNFGDVDVFEQVARGTWSDEARAKTVFLQGHNWSGTVFASKSGKSLTVEEDDVGLVATARMDPEMNAAQDLYRSVKRGDVGGQSVGFSIGRGFKESREEQDDGSVLYTIMKSPVLYESSAVWNPAYKDTTLGARQVAARMALRGHVGNDSVKRDDADRESARSAIERRVRIGRGRIAALRGKEQ